MSSPCKNCGRLHDRISSFCSEGCKLRFNELKPGSKSGCGCSQIVYGVIGIVILSAIFDKSDNKNTPAPTPSKVTTHTQAPPSSPNMDGTRESPSHQSPSNEGGSGSPQGKAAVRPSGLSADYLQITSIDGRTIWAKFIVKTKTTIMLRRSDGVDFEVPIESLTKSTLEEIESYREAKKKH